jgi:alkylation response protein AidB-like acyl-CoA dehydrogenase
VDFELSAEQADIQRAARSFAQGEFDHDLALELDRDHRFPLDLLRKAAKLGFVGIHYPEDCGGQGYGALENAIVAEEFCRADSGLGSALVLADFGAEIIKRYGTPDQRLGLLGPLSKGQGQSAAAFTEAQHGSDITHLDTVAVREEDSYVISGAKMFITNGATARFVIVLVQTDPTADPAYRGMSLIVVENGTPGFSAADVGDKLGIKMTSTAELTFDGVRVPASNLVGQENRGFYQTVEFFTESRVEMAALSLGIAQGAFDRALAYAKQRQQFGKRLVDFQVTQHKLADMATNIELARLLVYKAAWLIDHGKGDMKSSAMAKLMATRVGSDISNEAIQILGGYGLLNENQVERFYRDARIFEIIEGTTEIQKNAIARSILGKSG